MKFSKGKRTVVDGPFSEAGELIAGFCIIDVPSLEEAIEWARRSPPPHETGDREIEARQIFEQDAAVRAPAAANAKE